MSIDDRRDLRKFIHEFRVLMDEVTDGTTHPDLLSPERRSELRQAFEELVREEPERPSVFDRVRNAIVPAIETSPGLTGLSLTDADLIGANRARKTAGWRRAVQRFKRSVSRNTLGRAFRWANMILGSLAAVIPPAEALKELKEYAENLITDAEEDAAGV